MFSFSNQIGVDLGTTGVRVWVRTQGVVLDEPSVFAVDSKSGGLVGVGAAAEARHGGASPDALVRRPIGNGGAIDIEAIEAFLAWTIRRFGGRAGALGTSLMMAVSSGSTPMERRALRSAAARAGARKAHLIESPLAAGLGMALPVVKPEGRLVLVIGGGTTSAGLLSLGSVVASRFSHAAGSGFTEAVSRWLRKRASFVVGTRTAERIKKKLGTAAPDLTNTSMEINGRDLATGLPGTRTISAEELSPAFQEALTALVRLLRATLEFASPELVADVGASGVYLAGGGALFNQLDRYLERELGIDVVVAGDPRLTVIRGVAKAFDHLEVLERGLYPV